MATKTQTPRLETLAVKLVNSVEFREDLLQCSCHLTALGGGFHAAAGHADARWATVAERAGDQVGGKSGMVAGDVRRRSAGQVVATLASRPARRVAVEMP